MPDPADIAPKPWRTRVSDARVFVVAADGSVVTEIAPALMRSGWTSDKALRAHIADTIVAAVNASTPDLDKGPAPC